jgi:hypothetical protein
MLNKEMFVGGMMSVKMYRTGGNAGTNPPYS